EKYRALSRKYQAEQTPEQKAKSHEARVAWRKANKEHLDAQRKKRYEKKREQDLAKRAEWRKNHPEAGKATKQRFLSVADNRLWRLCSAAKRRAKRRGQEYEESLYATLQAAATRECACCHVEFDYSMGKGRTGLGPSLDRIDNLKGYTVDNVCLICFRCNVRKNSSTVAELEAI